MCQKRFNLSWNCDNGAQAPQFHFTCCLLRIVWLYFCEIDRYFKLKSCVFSSIWSPVFPATVSSTNAFCFKLSGNENTTTPRKFPSENGHVLWNKRKSIVRRHGTARYGTARPSWGPEINWLCKPDRRYGGICPGISWRAGEAIRFLQGSLSESTDVSVDIWSSSEMEQRTPPKCRHVRVAVQVVKRSWVKDTQGSVSQILRRWVSAREN